MFRSPLNVVHVGLEMLVSLINRADPTSPFISIDRDTADFIIQMFFSSESAINILNDLLQYEHIEAGTYTPTKPLLEEYLTILPYMIYRHFPPLLRGAELGECSGEQVRLGQRDGQPEGSGLPSDRLFLGHRVRSHCIQFSCR